ncbi:MAG: hypothetical protein KatS3mg008_1326 [Acidimicrobiales bacterium]|nr:MAG: hypothetical protein KatS3mg008_1326 [Acidimicrobiales bacterium]
MRVHMDGARLANAIVALGVEPAALTWRVGVDALSLGVTKCCGLDADVVVFFGDGAAQSYAETFEIVRKRGGHLLSKMWALSVQGIRALEDGLWLRCAEHANRMASRLAEGLSGIRSVELAEPVMTNELFVRVPPEVVVGMRRAGVRFHESGGSEGCEVRLVTSWATTPEEVDALCDLVRELTSG